MIRIDRALLFAFFAAGGSFGFGFGAASALMFAAARISGVTP